MKTVIYLAGAISGLSYDQATRWRQQVKECLSSEVYFVLDPMRNKEHLKSVPTITGSAGFDPLEIYTQDIEDIDKSHALLVNLAGVTGIGTPWEIGYAIAQGKEVILVADRDNSIRHHPFIQGARIKGDITLFHSLKLAINYLRG